MFRYTEMPLPRNWGNNSSACWSDSDEVSRDSVMLASVQIGNCMFHVQAMRVVTDDDGIQRVEDECFQTDYEHAIDLSGGGAFETVQIPDHDGEYVLVVYPFER